MRRQGLWAVTWLWSATLQHPPSTTLFCRTVRITVIDSHTSSLSSSSSFIVCPMHCMQHRAEYKITCGLRSPISGIRHPASGVRSPARVWKTSNGHNSATRHPIYFGFGSSVGFSGTADRTAPFPVGSNPRWRPVAILKKRTSDGLISVTRHPT